MKKLLQLLAIFITATFFGQAPTNGLIGYFGFENNYSNGNNTHLFVNASDNVNDVPFVAGKYGQGVSFSANNQYLVNSTLNSILTSSSDITIAFWQKPINVSDQYKTTFELFGSLYFRNYNGQNRVGLNSTLQNSEECGLDLFQLATDYGVWKHYAITTRTINSVRYLTIFVNGVISNNVAFPSLYQFTSKTIIGAGTDASGTLINSKRFSGVVDEFYIYSRSFTNAEIMLVMNDATLSSENFQSTNLKFSMYPNPANDNLNIEMEKEIQTVDIYSLLGQKVFSDINKNISIGNLSNGIYMVRVQDVDGAIATQKLIKN